MLLFFGGCDSTNENSSNALALTPQDEQRIEEYLDTRTEDISSPYQGGKMVSAFRILGTDADKIYLWMLKYEYLEQNSELTNGVSLPVVLTIATKDNHIVIIHHGFPKDGSAYSSSLEKLFPKNVRDQINMNPNEMVKELEQIIKNRINSN
jgi:hypothetical protein